MGLFDFFLNKKAITNTEKENALNNKKVLLSAASDETIESLVQYDFGECIERNILATDVKWYVDNRDIFWGSNFDKIYKILAGVYPSEKEDGFIMCRYAYALETIKNDYQKAQKIYLYGAKISNSWRVDNLEMAFELTLFKLKDPLTALKILCKCLLSISEANKRFGFKYQTDGKVSITQERAIQLFTAYLTVAPNFESYRTKIKNIMLATELDADMLREAAKIIALSANINHKDYSEILNILNGNCSKIVDKIYSLENNTNIPEEVISILKNEGNSTTSLGKSDFNSEIKKLKTDFSYHSVLIKEAEKSNNYERITEIAYCLYMSGNVTPAIRYLNKAAELKRADPLTPEMAKNIQSKQSEGAYYKQILGNVNSYSPEEGIKIFSEFIQRIKCCQEGYSSLGCFYSRNMQLDNALKYLNDALLLDPYSADTFNNIAMVYDKMGMQNKAVDYIRQGLAISPNHAMLRRNLSLMQKGQCAIQYMLINVESGNDNPGFMQEIVDDYKGEYDNSTKITAYNYSLDVLQKEEADIIKYGNNMDLVDWIDNQELKVKHGLSWAILTKYSKEQNVDLHGRSCYIDSKIKRGHRCIVIRIY